MATAIGITLPIRRGKTGYFNQSFEVLVQVKSNLINLLLTRKGERLFQPNFGSDLHSIIFNQLDGAYDQSVKAAVKSAVSQWMPFLNIIEQNVVRTEDTNRTLLQLTFSLKSNAQITETLVIEF